MTLKAECKNEGYCFECMRCFDCGANVGKWTRPLSNIFNKVIAIEPDGRAIKYNRAKQPRNVELINAAVGRVAGKAEFSMMPHTMNSRLGFSEKAKEIINVIVIVLDQFVNQEIDFIKIDVEGAEVDVLTGGLELFKAKKPIIIVETHNTQEQVREYVKEHIDYTIHEFGESPRFQFVCLPN